MNEIISPPPPKSPHISERSYLSTMLKGLLCEFSFAKLLFESAAEAEFTGVVEQPEVNGRVIPGKRPSPPSAEKGKEHTSGDDSEATVHSTSDDASPTTPRSDACLSICSDEYVICEADIAKPSVSNCQAGL